ncbi:hypothetical protein HS1genome_1815 [Sulfodiicoccus acidiphilus]|uniref:Ribonuclease VapC n=1 Tax=Sulfodiicoccus acidiphilus TaxID=1670455 RepID=A0A348B5H4_9CREN|nr:type II toxin-antitoxin system VapC family toxin [Sulfodiicoccus acidiphilus]BBD73426.1 hypothetical protein HS1genome_1815 [Sulfodiicoccus acidiphilus]GGT98621.1 hypothetical protein GCM10007116_15040 [Sulfodiicoccus acidiphilus]
MRRDELLFVDSNVFFYAKVGDRRYGECCARVISALYAGRLKGVVDTLVLLEVGNSLRKFNVDFKSPVEAILSLPLTVYTPSVDDVVEGIAVGKERGMSPYDALHAVVAEKLGAKVLSADSDFRERLDPCDLAEDLGPGA